MIKILMLNTNNAYLPEIDNYKQYFFGIADIYTLDEIAYDDIKYFDVIWEFMGFNFKKSKLHSQILIHEYPSLSAGYFPCLKNYIKQKFNAKPDFRIFLNENVRSGLNFKDNIGYCYRDMGVHKAFFNYVNSSKEYDFVYIGEINKNRDIDVLLNKFTKKQNRNLSILLIGTPKNDIYKKYRRFDNIIFAGFIPYKGIPSLASRAVYGINWVPNKYPYNLQTSTKLLEYCALGLKIINLNNDWSLNFEKEYSGKFFNIEQRTKINIKDIEKFNFITPDVSSLEWTSVFEKSKIKDTILNII